MNTCETCKHWSHPDTTDIETFWGLPDDVANEDAPKVQAPGMWGECTLVAFAGPHNGSEKFYVVDASKMYAASLNTRDDFGCVEWESK